MHRQQKVNDYVRVLVAHVGEQQGRAHMSAAQEDLRGALAGRLIEAGVVDDAIKVEQHVLHHLRHAPDWKVHLGPRQHFCVNSPVSAPSPPPPNLLDSIQIPPPFPNLLETPSQSREVTSNAALLNRVVISK